LGWWWYNFKSCLVIFFHQNKEESFPLLGRLRWRNKMQIKLAFWKYYNAFSHDEFPTWVPSTLFCRNKAKMFSVFGRFKLWWWVH
jgi:hypothetical protein